VLEALANELGRYRRLSRLPPEQLQRAIERADEDLARLLSGGISSLVSAGSNPAVVNRFQDAQAMHAVAMPVGRAMLELLEGLRREQWRELREQELMVFNTRPADGEWPLPGPIRDQLRGAKPEIGLPKGIITALTSAPGAEDSFSQLAQLMQTQWEQAADYRVTLHLTLSLSGSPTGMLRVTPQPAGNEATGPLFVLSGLMITAAPLPFEEPTEDPGEREARLAADPLLGKKAVLKLPPPPKYTGLMAMFGGVYRVPDVLPAVEEAFGVRLLVDAYARQAVALFSPTGPGEVLLYRVLDRLAGFGRRWEREGDVIRLKSRTWAHDRRGEIQARMIRRWEALREKQRGFTLADLAQIAGARVMSRWRHLST
jgi:hypothetical protein